MPNQNQNADFSGKEPNANVEEAPQNDPRNASHSNSIDGQPQKLSEAGRPLGAADGGSFSRSKRSTPGWQIPVGVTQGNWDYVRSSSIATDYDQFLKGHPLTEADASLLAELIDPAIQRLKPDETVVADFGCGNGRSLLPLLRQGVRGIGIDLSLPMLSAFRKKYLAIEESSGHLDLVQANLVELEAMADDSVDVGVCLFSTLGMIQGHANRRAFLQHVRRIVKPEGSFVLHAHNLWYQLRHPGGFRWLIGHALASLRWRVEFGDRVANYRGVRDLCIHSFRHGELRSALTETGWQPKRWYGLRQDQRQAEKGLPWFHALRCVGWIVECEREGTSRF